MFLMPFLVVLSLTFLFLLALMELFYLLFLLPYKLSINVAKQALDFPLLDTMVSSSQCPKILLLFTSFGLKDNGKIKNVLNDRLNYLLSSYFNPMMSASEFLEKFIAQYMTYL